MRLHPPSISQLIVSAPGAGRCLALLKDMLPPYADKVKQVTKERQQKLLFQQAQKRKRRNWLNSYREYYHLFRQQLMISPSGHSLKSEIHSFSIARLRGLLFPQRILYQSSIQQRLLSLRLLHQARVTKARALRLSF